MNDGTGFELFLPSWSCHYLILCILQHLLGSCSWIYLLDICTYSSYLGCASLEAHVQIDRVLASHAV